VNTVEGQAGTTIEQLGLAIQTWSLAQNKQTSVAEAMAAFNASRDAVIHAIETCQWMRIEGPDDLIEHEE
jgi:hypothetical protein